jgi:hypothetical protein
MTDFTGSILAFWYVIMTPGTVYKHVDVEELNRGEIYWPYFSLFDIDPDILRKAGKSLWQYSLEISLTESIMCLYERFSNFNNKEICDRLVLTSSGRLGWIWVSDEPVDILIDPSNAET